MQTQTSQVKWPGFGYVPVRGLADRLIARQLRAARKNMTRFFRERGMFDFGERMERIRKSNAGMMEKNQAFQGVLDDYAQRVNPQPAPAGDPSKAADLETPENLDVDLQDPVVGRTAVDSPARTGSDSDSGVPGLEGQDAGLVIEE